MCVHVCVHIQEFSSLVDSYLSCTYQIRNGIFEWKELLKNWTQESCIHKHTHTGLLCLYVYQHSLMTTCRPESVLILIYRMIIDILCIISWFWIEVFTYVFFYVDISRNFHCCPLDGFKVLQLKLLHHMA